MEAQGADFSVYCGRWVNWSRGPVFGATLTLSRGDGNLVIAFVAFFVAFVGTSIWRIICFVLHNTYSTSDRNDALYHQRQAVLRNSSSAAGGLLAFAKLFWSWRPHGGRPYRRVVPVLLLAIICVACFTATSGFSSKVSTAVGSEVLLSGAHCGLLEPPANFNDSTAFGTLLAEYNPVISRAISSADTYARECYTSNQTTGVLSCGTFVQKSLPTSVISNASCPFVSDICQTKNANLILDTGHLDSHDDFGLNTQTNIRFTYRHKLHCAPLRTDGGYKDQWNASDTRSYSRYNYGSNLFPLKNFTYWYTNDARADRQANNVTNYQVQNDYTITVVPALYNHGIFDEGLSEFRPIDDLRFTIDGSALYLIFLSANDISFTEETLDPWYRATIPVTRRMTTGSRAANATVYKSSEAASPLACVEYEEVCRPSQNGQQDPQCASFGQAENMATSPITRLFEGDAHDAFLWSARSSFSHYPSIDFVTAVLGSHSLTSRSNFEAGFQGPLSDTQWQMDVAHWNALSLAALQTFFVNTATGASRSTAARWTKGPNNTVENSLCQNQKIISTAYISFSIFGLAFIFTVGLVIILISLNLETIVYGQLRPRRRQSQRTYRGKPAYALLEWRANETLQLQRLSQEEGGFGTWSNTFYEVPVTQPGQLLANFDVRQNGLPGLQSWAIPAATW